MALKSSDRFGAVVSKIVIHTAEGATTKESLYRYFDQPNVQASSHVGIDAGGVADWVPRGRAAWTLRNGNRTSVNAELCGFARWSRQQWLSTRTVDGCKNPRQMIRNTAAWIVREARALGIPLHRLSVTEWRQGKKGYADHDTYTKATGDGSHWDVGKGFPWDVLAADIKEITTPQGEEDVNLNDKLSPAKMADGKEYALTVGDALHGMVQYIAGQSGAGDLTAHPQGQYVGRVLSLAEIKADVDSLTQKVDAILSKLNESGGPINGS